MEREYKTFKFDTKALGEQGSFEGLASVYGNRDLGDDIVEPGAFTKTLSERKGEITILWQHDPRMPIGKGELVDSSEGLIIKGKLSLGAPIAHNAYALLKDGVLKGLSIGYDKVKSDVKDGVRHLKELKLWEVSLVTFPMNELATVHGVKQQDIDDARMRLAEFVVEHKISLKALFEEQAAALKALIPSAAAMSDGDVPESFHTSLGRISQLFEGNHGN